ncbi:hypothetical protein HFO77_25450 [Rhizobium leguminosarum]|uniref:hypothetical protein n=1 Tax=Rhizobium leguminosarum TaxID=384 RepID=UPI001C94E17E|nr:hypothetical protein [Rhizobium leguminosarum]MBY5917742.1 hypothetical protein [Rhizobium leguminosarum]
MTNRTSNLVSLLNDRVSGALVPSGSFVTGSLFQMILRGDAKLPLDRVEEVASAIGADVRQLFRLAARQFYDEDAIRLFERMLDTPMTNEEQMWLKEIRSAAIGPVSAPSGMAKRLVRALAAPKGPAPLR